MRAEIPDSARKATRWASKYGSARAIRASCRRATAAAAADAARAALLAFVRLHELGALRYCGESGAAVHTSAGHPSPKGSSGRRSCGQACSVSEAAPANNMGQSICIQGDTE